VVGESFKKVKKLKIERKKEKIFPVRRILIRKTIFFTIRKKE